MMTLDLFGWIRRRVAQAILAGVDDGLAAIEAGEAPIPAELPQRLAARLALAAPEANAEEQANGKRRSR